MANAYEYQPLPDQKSIRVLILGPGQGDEPLSGALKTIHLNSRRRDIFLSLQAKILRKPSSRAKVRRWKAGLPYEAISYVWGSNVKDHSIVLSGKTHHITANLSDALHQCRQTDQPRVLWADSICIDQDKLEEKNHQVYMMGRIYASSQRTLICLGTDPNNRDHARDALRVISDANRMIQEEFQRPGFSWEPNSFPRPLPEDPLVHDSRWQSVDILLNLPWFQRGWVMQEAALGRGAYVLWADRKIALMDAIRVHVWYKRRARDKSHFLHMDNYMPLLFRQIFFHQRKTEARVFWPSNRGMDDLNILLALEHARGLDLSDPRDRIYAFMALPFVKNSMPALHPNYEQQHLEVYQDFALKYLENTSDLNILCFVAHEEVKGAAIRSTLGSSWVPRWDHMEWVPRIGEVAIRNFGLTSAEPAEFMIMRGEDDASAKLQVRVVIFDSIKLISWRITSSMTVEDLIELWSLWSNEAGSAITPRDVGPSPDNDSLAFLGALTRGLSAGANYEEWVEMLKLYSRFLQHSKQEDPLSPGSAQMSPDIRFCHRYLMSFCHNSHIFSLERGYYGLGSWAIKQDDVCAFVFGVKNPIILRKVPDAGVNHYKVIGPAYVVSKHLDELGITPGLHEWDNWDNWDRLRGFHGWTDWGLKEEKIILL